jgi:hypothetical protein
MATAASQAHPVSTNATSSAAVNPHGNHVNGQTDHPEHSGASNAGQSAMASNTMSKKGKGKKASDPNETSKLLAAKISQLEQDAAGEKDQEAEIGRFTPIPGIYYAARPWMV